MFGCKCASVVVVVAAAAVAWVSVPRFWVARASVSSSSSSLNVGGVIVGSTAAVVAAYR